MLNTRQPISQEEASDSIERATEAIRKLKELEEAAHSVNDTDCTIAIKIAITLYENLIETIEPTDSPEVYIVDQQKACLTLANLLDISSQLKINTPII